MTNKLRLALPILVAIISFGFIAIAQAAPVDPVEILEVNVDYELGRLTIEGTGLDDGTFDNVPILTLGGYLLTNVSFTHLDPTIGPETIQGDIDLASLFPVTGEYLLIVDPNFKRAKTAELVLTIQGSSTAHPSNSTGDIIGSVDICEFLGIDKVIVYIPGRSFVVRPASDGSFEMNFVPPGSYDIVMEANDGEVVSTLSGVVVNDKQQTDIGMVSVCIDADGDGYDAVEDCNDSDDSINPGALEICNAIDDNCNDTIDEGWPTTEFWRDSDGDNYGDNSNTINLCERPNGYVTPGAADCDDSDPRVRPGQIQWFVSARRDGTFDYDCDGIDHVRWPGGNASCQLSTSGTDCDLVGSGIWYGPEPACGVAAEQVAGCEYSSFPGPSCSEDLTGERQACR